MIFLLENNLFRLEIVKKLWYNYKKNIEGNKMSNLDNAVKFYSNLGVDVFKAIDTLKDTTISIHCWQGDDVVGFDNSSALSGGIQTTGNYPGRARTPEELMQDFEKAISFIPGKKKLNLHAMYAIIPEGEKVDRDAITPAHFKPWVDFAKKHGLGIDFNPSFFSHPMVKDNLTLSSPDEEVRKFWIEHGKACIKISEYFAEETNEPCVMNIWIPDGYKNVPADRLGPRKRFKDSLDQILSIPFDKTKVYITLESKVFGIGLESYTVGSGEFCLSYSNDKKITPLMDNGHYHPTEVVSDKISALLLFNDKIALHVTRPVRWDSDHVILLDDELKEICTEIVRCDALNRVFIATDYFDASINRISAWVTGVRNVQKALLLALLTPHDTLKKLQEENDFTSVMVLQEKLKTAPFYDVWIKYLEGQDLTDDYIDQIKDYEKQVLLKR